MIDAHYTCRENEFASRYGEWTQVSESSWFSKEFVADWNPFCLAAIRMSLLVLHVYRHLLPVARIITVRQTIPTHFPTEIRITYILVHRKNMNRIFCQGRLKLLVCCLSQFKCGRELRCLKCIIMDFGWIWNVPDGLNIN